MDYSVFIVIGIVVAFILYLIGDISESAASKKEIQKKISERDAALEREITKLNESGLVRCVHSAMSKQFTEAIEKRIDYEINFHHHKPESSSVWESVGNNYFSINNDNICFSSGGKFYYTYYSKLGYTNLKSEQIYPFRQALVRYLGKWQLKNGGCLYPNEKVWEHYIEKEIEYICTKKGIKSLKKV